MATTFSPQLGLIGRVYSHPGVANAARCFPHIPSPLQRQRPIAVVFTGVFGRPLNVGADLKFLFKLSI